MKIQHYNVFVIGSGSAGKKVAESCVESGLTVAIADNREFGGTCSNRGCDPKKVFLGPSQISEMASNLRGHGVESEVQINWKKLQKFKKTFTSFIPAATEKDLKDKGITLYHQSPKFLDENLLSVEGKTIRAGKIVIATGMIPKPMDIEGSQLLKVSDDFLALRKLPKHLIFVGGGYIAMEFAHMAARAGSRVTILERGNRILKPFDKDMVIELEKTTQKLGIRIVYNAEVSKVEKLRKNYRVYYLEEKEEKSMKAGMIFNTTGRVPAIDQLDLEKGNISYSDQGVEVNEYLQNPQNPNVYACGDVSDNGLPLSPLSGIEGTIVADNILKEQSNMIDLPIVPSVVFTLPNLASVGLSEEEAKSRYKKIKVNCRSASDWYNARRIRSESYFYKILINERTSEIVGAHLLSPHAGETINLFTMAINQKITTDELKKMIFTYPSWSNDIKSML